MGEEQEQKFHQLTEEPVSRVISHLAVPCIISMLVTAFYNMADTFFVGMLRSNAATGAVGVVFSMMAVIQAVGFFFGHGSGNFISRELGRRNTDSASNMAATGFFSALAAVPCGVELPHPPGIPAGFHRDHPSLCPGVSAGHLTGHPVDDRLSGFEQPSGRPAGPAGIRSLHHPLRHPHPVPRSGRNGPGPGGQLNRTEKAGVPSGTPAFCVFLICRRSPWPLPRCAPRSGRTA